ncbi:AlkA N-terminal domain-containing protein [Shewanella sp. UCD-KL12]|uniref:AlkA N-terminal domain-containing protein n=1 Tax=Shewanella sp. UCD-KL12 TaxID=1917163 RepID=UPI0009704F61|nr:AlkA N-terminal domain-containing protein [Shewanella sp. UCD-KL12]
MNQPCKQLSNESYRKARLARDSRFDGKFFIGVLTTGIFCRPICPAVAPKEKNVRYFDSAISAITAGLRPCLRCRPDSAPNSSAWKGTRTSIERALALVESGVLSGPDAITIEALADKLGVSSRYLRQLFTDNFGTSPKRYAQFRDLMFAKQLLHQTDLPVTQVAFASGFNSVRRFNESFKASLKLTPSALRKQAVNYDEKQFNLSDKSGVALSLFFSYRPPLDWDKQLAFHQVRMVEGMEWVVENCGYGRSFQLDNVSGYFEATHEADKHGFNVSIYLSSSDELSNLKDVVGHIKRLLDLDADMTQVEAAITSSSILGDKLITGLRLPGTWSLFEAGCRAVLGQQVSIIQATKLLNQLVETYGKRLKVADKEVILFPTPQAIATAPLNELKMPGARKAALNALGQYVSEHPNGDVEDWLSIKGIGPWTIAYAKMRGLGDPNVLLCSDLVVKKRVLKLYEERNQSTAPKASESLMFNQAVLPTSDYAELTKLLAEQVSPWGSYLTFQLWNLS